MNWHAVLERHGGIATSAQLRDAAVPAYLLTAAVRTGEVLRPRRGIYALPDASRPAIAAVTAGGRLSCVSAARSYGLWGGTDARLHVHVPPHATRLPDSGAVRHWVAGEAHQECWRVSIADCLRSVVRCADAETAIAVLDTALSAGSATFAGIRALFASESLRARRVAAEARPGSDSGVESVVRQRLEARGHVIEQQVAVPGVGRVDLRVDGTLFVEIDGFAYHSERSAFDRDRARDTMLMIGGARRLRFSARQVLEEWGSVAAAIETVLAVPEFRPLAPLGTA